MKKRTPARSDATQETAKPKHGNNDPAPRLKIDSVRSGAPGVAIIAAGGSSFSLRLDDARSLGLDPARLAPGTELLEAESDIVEAVAESFAAEKQGMALIALTEHSAFTMRIKLEKRGFSSRAIGLAIARLQESGLLDDRRFARLFAESRLRRRAEGPSSLLAALRSRGVDADTAASVIAELLGRETAPEERSAVLEKAAIAALKKYKGDKARARERLRDLGFHSAEIREFLSRDE